MIKHALADPSFHWTCIYFVVTIHLKIFKKKDKEKKKKIYKYEYDDLFVRTTYSRVTMAKKVVYFIE